MRKEKGKRKNTPAILSKN